MFHLAFLFESLYGQDWLFGSEIRIFFGVVVLTVSQDIICVRFILLNIICCNSNVNCSQFHSSSYASEKFCLIKHPSFHIIFIVSHSTSMQIIKTLRRRTATFFVWIEDVVLLLGQHWITNWSAVQDGGKMLNVCFPAHFYTSTFTPTNAQWFIKHELLNKSWPTCFGSIWPPWGH
jgi:hypothetical protein